MEWLSAHDVTGH